MKLKKFDLNHKPRLWQLRSADSYNSNLVSIVSGNGRVSSYYTDSTNCGGVLSACIII